MALGEEDDPRMASDAEMVTQVQEHVITLRIRVDVAQTDAPDGWLWTQLLDLNGSTETVQVLQSAEVGDTYMVGEDGQPVDGAGPGVLWELVYARDGELVQRHILAADREAAELEALAVVNQELRTRYGTWQQAVEDCDGSSLEPL